MKNIVKKSLFVVLVLATGFSIHGAISIEEQKNSATSSINQILNAFTNNGEVFHGQPYGAHEGLFLAVENVVRLLISRKNGFDYPAAQLYIDQQQKNINDQIDQLCKQTDYYLTKQTLEQLKDLLTSSFNRLRINIVRRQYQRMGKVMKNTNYGLGHLSVKMDDGTYLPFEQAVTKPSFWRAPQKSKDCEQMSAVLGKIKNHRQNLEAAFQEQRLISAQARRMTQFLVEMLDKKREMKSDDALQMLLVDAYGSLFSGRKSNVEKVIERLVGNNPDKKNRSVVAILGQLKNMVDQLLTFKKEEKRYELFGQTGWVDFHRTVGGYGQNLLEEYRRWIDLFAQNKLITHDTIKKHTDFIHAHSPYFKIPK